MYFNIAYKMINKAQKMEMEVENGILFERGTIGKWPIFKWTIIMGSEGYPFFYRLQQKDES